MSKSFGHPDPLQDARRVRTAQLLGNMDGGGEMQDPVRKRIYLWTDEDVPQVFDADESGFAAAIDAATSGNSIELPDGDLLLADDYVVPPGVNLRGTRATRVTSTASVGGLFPGDGSVIVGFDFENTDSTTGAVVCGAAVLLEDMRITGALYGVEVGDNCEVRNCRITQTAGSIDTEAALLVNGTGVKVQLTELNGSNLDISLVDGASVELDNVIASTSYLGSGAAITLAPHLGE